MGFHTVGSAGSAELARAVLSRVGARFATQRAGGRVAFLIDNPRGLDADEHPFATKLSTALSRSGIHAVALRVR